MRGRKEKEIEQRNLKAHQSEPLSISVGFAKQTMAVYVVVQFYTWFKFYFPLFKILIIWVRVESSHRT